MIDGQARTKGPRCAVYTRKSSEEGLEQSFNSLHAQREACEAYVRSQMHEGWTIVETAYDDGGFSGGTMERPALQALLDDIRGGKIDVVVVYKIDRLTRSLFDFAKIVETFDAATVSFVSVTQSFNTTTSMGRLTLNVLLSFAQFEREVTGERIRDKIAASRRKGMWMGGNIPLGYDLRDHRLIVTEKEATTIRTIFDAYVRLGTVRKVKAELDALGLTTKLRTRNRGAGNETSGGLPFMFGHLYHILRNPIYIGKVRHKHHVHPGEHEAIVSPELWGAVQSGLASQSVQRLLGRRIKSPSLLTGKVFDARGRRLTPTHAVKHTKRYRYYSTIDKHDLSQKALRLPATDIEGIVCDAVRSWLLDASNIAALVQEDKNVPGALTKTIEQAAALARTYDESEAWALLLKSILRRVEVGETKISIEVDVRALRDALGATVKEGRCGDSEITIERDFALQRKGKEQRLIVTTATANQNVDPILIKAIVRARRWFNLLRSGQVSSIAELGRRENAHRAWISNQLSLAFLAPDIVEAIVEGVQPANLTLDRLVELAGASFDWSVQRKASTRGL